MTVYNVNFGIGWASSGIEYAQAYRAKLLRQLNRNIKFIFLDFISSENIQTLTDNLGFKDDEVIWLYQYFSDIKIAPTTYTLDDLIGEIGNEITHIEDNGKIKRLYFNDETLRAVAKTQNISHPALIKRRDKILEKLKKLIEEI